MKFSIFTLMLFVMSLTSSASSCSKSDDNNTENNETMADGKINITVGSETFSATLLDNSSARAFKELLPLTLDMEELNSNEKYADLPKSLPTNSYNPQTIKNGDLMLYGSRTLVLFYKTFSTSYSYTRLGKVEDPTGLATALGSGTASVTFDVE